VRHRKEGGFRVSEELRTEKYFIVYLDLLGSENRIIGENSEKWLNVINNLYSTSLTYKKKLLKNVYIHENSHVKIFSDNIVVAVKVPEDSASYSNALDFLSYFTSYFQTHALIDSQWLVRGCLTIGDLYINEKTVHSDDDQVIKSSMIWGEALVRAHHYEANLAIYPRIIIDEKLRLTKDDSHDKNFGFIFPVLLGEDGLFSLDYLSLQMQSDIAIKPINIVKKARSSIKKIRNEAKEDEKILQKVAWTEKYIDDVSKSDLMKREDPNPSDVLYQVEK